MNPGQHHPRDLGTCGRPALRLVAGQDGDAGERGKAALTRVIALAAEVATLGEVTEYADKLANLTDELATLENLVEYADDLENLADELDDLCRPRIAADQP